MDASTLLDTPSTAVQGASTLDSSTKATDANVQSSPPQDLSTVSTKKAATTTVVDPIPAAQTSNQASTSASMLRMEVVTITVVVAVAVLVVLIVFWRTRAARVSALHSQVVLEENVRCHVA
jgi:cobalamin biosynthesis Mg chelatase CobN